MKADELLSREARARQLRVHPAAEVWPMLSDSEIDGLAASIAQVGLLHPLVVWRDENGERWLLDGRNRLAACERAGVKPAFETYTGDDPALYVLAANEHRRHATASQRAMAVALTANATHATGGAHHASANLQKQNDDVTSADAAYRGGVSIRLVDACRYVAERYPDLTDAVLAGTIKASAAEAEARRRMTEREQAERQFAERLAGQPAPEDMQADYPELADQLADETADSDSIITEYRARVAQDCAAVHRLAQATSALEKAATDLVRASRNVEPHTIDVAARHGTTHDAARTRRAIAAASRLTTQKGKS